MSLWSTTFSDDYSDEEGTDFGVNIEKVFVIESSSDSSIINQFVCEPEAKTLEKDYFTIVAERNGKIYNFSDLNNFVYEAIPDKIYENKYSINKLEGYKPELYGEIIFKDTLSSDVYDSNKERICSITVDGFSYTKFCDIEIKIIVYNDDGSYYTINSSQLADDGELRTFVIGSEECPYIIGSEQLANQFLLESFTKMNTLVLYGLIISLFRKIEDRNKHDDDEIDM